MMGDSLMDWSAWIPRNWGDLEALAVIIALIYASLQLKYARGQMEEAARTRKLQATRELLNEIAPEEVRVLRTWVIDEMDSPAALEKKEDHAKARRVAVAYDRVGYMIEQGLIPEDALFKFQQDEITLLWQKLKPVIEDVRRERKRPNYCKSFEWLAETWLPKKKTHDESARSF